MSEADHRSLLCSAGRITVARSAPSPRSDPKTGDIVATVELEDTAPEGAAADGKGHIFVNNEGKNTIQVIDVKTWKATASWPLAPCAGPTGIAYDKASESCFLRLQQCIRRSRSKHGQGRGDHQE